MRTTDTLLIAATRPLFNGGLARLHLIDLPTARSNHYEPDQRSCRILKLIGATFADTLVMAGGFDQNTATE